MVGWRELDAELDAWAAAGRRATLWWRDDDAVSDGPALRRLLRLAADLGIPLSVAVIPARARPDLAEALNTVPGVHVVQHGWDHENHAAPSGRKAELAPGRPWRRVLAELARGREILSAMFAGCFLPVLVPPWNRIDPGLVGRLPGAGYAAVSTFKPRQSPMPAPGLVQINCHVDPVDWRGSRGFVGEEAALSAAVSHLRARRTGAADPEEPTGILTHHRVHDEAAWTFLGAFGQNLRGHAAAAWISLGTAMETTA